MQIGDLATWVGALGTTGALGFTAYTLRRQVERDRLADDERRRMQAKNVSVALIGDHLVAARVVNGSSENIYMVNVTIQDKATGGIFADSGRRIDLIRAGEAHEFRLERQDPSSPEPRGYTCIAQFSDSNGYRWHRYMMGLLEPAGRRAQAMSVRVSLVGDQFDQARVFNGSSDSIYMVGVTIESKVTRSVFADSGKLIATLGPSESCDLNLKPSRPDAVQPTTFYCIASFSDSSGNRWNRYMMGHLERASGRAKSCAAIRRWGTRSGRRPSRFAA
jgi:hypothetical protein